MSLFKAYDLRGRVPDELNEDIAYKIGRAYCEIYHPRKVAVGYDIRNESIALSNALMRGLTEGGSDVMNIGLSGTEEVYFATFHHQLDGGIMITASHNPRGHNGMKLIKHQARPISSDTGLFDIRDRVERGSFFDSTETGKIENYTDKSDYISHLLKYVDRYQLKPLKILVNPGNGGAGLVVKRLERWLPFQFIYMNEEPDGDFPNGVPNPLLKENQQVTADAVVSRKADLGIAWDGDYDRCFFFDHKGRFIEGYYLVGLLAEMALLKSPGSAIVHDPRLIWNTQEMVKDQGGRPVLSKCGHAFIKQVMRDEDAAYGGEMSAHHYFRDFAYCDSGMIPWLLITELMCRSGKSLKELVDQRIEAFPCSGEINFRVQDAQTKIEEIQGYYQQKGGTLDTSDGISFSFPDWRFNLRASNTEPLLRLNIESRGDESLVDEKVQELTQLINS